MYGYIPAPPVKHRSRTYPVLESHPLQLDFVSHFWMNQSEMFVCLTKKGPKYKLFCLFWTNIIASNVWPWNQEILGSLNFPYFLLYLAGLNFKDAPHDQGISNWGQANGSTNTSAKTQGR